MGRYSLRQVDQKAVPVDIQNGPWLDITTGHRYNLLIISVVGGEAVLDTGRFSLRFDLMVNSDGLLGSPTLRLEGDYEIVGNQIVFDPDGTTTLPAGSVQKGAISMGVDLMAKGANNTYTFRK